MDGYDTPTFQIDSPYLRDLAEAGKWARIFAIFMFIMSGFLILMAFMGGALFSSLSEFSEVEGMGSTIGGGFFFIFYLAIGGLYVFIGLKLWNFAKLAVDGVRAENQDIWLESFRHLKSYFLVMAVISIIGLAFIALGLFVALIAGAATTF